MNEGASGGSSLEETGNDFIDAPNVPVRVYKQKIYTFDLTH